jgi:hypothetical protein
VTAVGCTGLHRKLSCMRVRVRVRVLTPACPPVHVLCAEAGVAYPVQVTCTPPTGGFPVAGFQVSLDATQDTPNLPAGSCTGTATEDLDVTVTLKPALAVTKLTSTDLCESATGGLQQVATFQVVTDVAGSDVSLELEGEPEGVTCTATPAVPGTVTGEAGAQPGQHWHTGSFVWRAGPAFQLGLCTPATSSCSFSHDAPCYSMRLAVRPLFLFWFGTLRGSALKQ